MLNIKSNDLTNQSECLNKHQIQLNSELIKSAKRKKLFLKYRKSFLGRLLLAHIHRFVRQNGLYIIQTSSQADKGCHARYIKRLILKGYRVRLVKLQ